MIVDDLVSRFYNKLLNKRILIIVHHDIDAICAVKILQMLLKCDSRVYTLEPVQGIEDLKEAYETYRHDIKHILLLNCGGTIDIVETLNPEEDCVFYILDSHKPTDITNVFNNQQVCVLTRLDDVQIENIPEYQEIFDDEDSDEEEDEDDDEEDGNEETQQNKRRRLDENAIIKRRQKRIWEDNRKRILFEYTQFSYYGRSSAMLMYELAWKMSKSNLELLWYGIIGVMEQFILNKIPTSLFKSDVEFIKNESGRLNPSAGDELETSSHATLSSNVGQIPGLRIECEDDAQLALYKHWTLQASLRHTIYTAVSLKLWTIKGEQRLQRLLAEMGLPLVQSKQLYNSMDLSLRKELPVMLTKIAETHKLEDLIMPSFTMVQGYRIKIQASDYVYAMLSLLETPTQDKKASDCFLDAWYCLSRQNKELLNDGISNAKKFLTSMFKTVQSVLDMKQVNCAGPFLYVFIQEGSVDYKYYSKPHALSMLAMFTLKAYVASSASSRKRNMSRPLIASAPLDALSETCLMIGIPPVSEIIPRSFFGKAFEQAAEKTNARVSFDYFDSSIISIHKSDRHKFIDALYSLLM